ncbi:conserved hypothetical protein [Gloeothece citriformis PCC 7424]|uniref:DUF3172 domain-containing protein n=1 Tax=Gloeothece citriformis (strain PCC 7424) TaxID=65393 RepID=B7KJV7_GLOC7|nr:DUF3172 domain-containing protein [Gloeothece citriformis]ACK69556.1 conserved hypothetical protein [Gloeothece citriformis PCC 7424]
MNSKIRQGFNYFMLIIVAVATMVGIAIGIGFSSYGVSDASNVASSQFIDVMAPSSPVCVQNGASAVTLDARFFVTFNPFSVYISRPTMQPGCVLRQTNWSILEQNKLVTHEQVQECKDRMNTFGFTGELESSPQIDCLYRNDKAGNFFLSSAK